MLKARSMLTLLDAIDACRGGKPWEARYLLRGLPHKELADVALWLASGHGLLADATDDMARTLTQLRAVVVEHGDAWATAPLEAMT